MSEADDRRRKLESEIERRLSERFAAMRDEFDRLRLEADRRWAGFLSRFDQDFTGLVPPELVQAPPAPETQAAAGSFASSGDISLADARGLDEADNQVEVLRRYLELVGRHASRAALFVSRSGSLGAWKAIGFSERGGNDDSIRRVTLESNGGAIAAVLRGEPARLDAGNEVSSKIGAWDAVSAVLIPMAVKEKISGLLYADCVAGEEDRFRPDAIALLTYVTGLVVDRLATRKLRPAPALCPIAQGEAALAAVAPSGEAAAEPETAEEVEDDGQAEEIAAAEPKQPEAEPPSFAAVPHPEEPAAPPPVGREEPQPEADYSAETVRMPSLALPLSLVETKASVPEASAPIGGARRLAGPLAPADADERREEARRFARLLVSEIKLYNERVVQEGREKGNLYERLRDDIDRSRQMYDERIPEDVRASSNFFYEELVRVLADGRPEALGL